MSAAVPPKCPLKCLPKNTVLSEVLEGVELKLQQMALSLYLHTALEKPEIAPGQDC